MAADSGASSDDSEAVGLTSEKRVVKQDSVEMVELDVKEDEKSKYSEESSSERPLKISKNGAEYKYWQLDYEYGWWGLTFALLAWAVIDRYTWMLWPLWVKSPGPLANDPHVSVFVVVSWISSRVLLVATSVVLVLQMRVMWNWIFENRPSWLNVNGDIMEINNRLHYWMSVWFIGIPVCAHVWSIFWPVMFGTDLKIYWEWSRPVDPATGNRVEFYNPDERLLSLSINDIYRVITTSLCFFFFFPYSMTYVPRAKSYLTAMNLHILAASIFLIDSIRMYSHPHTWVFNCPVILAWMIDRLYGIFYYRRHVGHVVKRVKLGDSYMILYLRMNSQDVQRHVGDFYYLNLLECGWDRAHPFSVMTNYSKTIPPISRKSTVPDWKGHKFAIRKSQGGLDVEIEESLDLGEDSSLVMSRMETHDEEPSDGPLLPPVGGDADEQSERDAGTERFREELMDLERFTDYDTALVIQTFPKHTDVLKRTPWTWKLQQISDNYLSGLRAWGPYRSDYIYLEDQLNLGSKMPELVLIATGTGIPFVIDFYEYFVSTGSQLPNKVTVYFSTRSIHLFQWVTNVICRQHVDNFFVNAHLTGHAKIHHVPRLDKSRQSRIGRLSFEEILKAAGNGSHVYFCGNPSLQSTVKKLASHHNLVFHEGHAFHT